MNTPSTALRGLGRDRWVITGAALALLTACDSGLQRIDRQAQEIISQRADLMGGDTATPEFDFMDSKQGKAELDAHRAASVSKRPPTLNPSARELILRPADPSRNLAEILDTYTTLPTDVPVFNLDNVLQLATSRSPEYLTAKEQLYSASLSLLSQRHQFGPRFFDDVVSSVNASGEGGDYAIVNDLSNEFRITRRLETGGQVGIQAIVSATEQLRETVADNSAQSAEVLLSADFPLLRGAGTVAAEGLISAERQMVYAMRTFENFRRNFLVDVASDYFDIVRARTLVTNAQEDLKSRERSLEEAEAKTREFTKIDIAEAQQRLLQAQNSLASARDNYILALERFRVRLGLNADEIFLIDPDSSFDFPIPALDMEEGVERGLAYRLDLQNQRDQVDDTRRAVDVARNDLLPDLNFGALVSLPTDADKTRAGLQFDPESMHATATLTLSLPIDRKIEKINLRQALINLEQAKRDLTQREDEVAINIRASVRQIELAQFSLQLQDESIRITEERIEALELRRTTTPRQVIDAQDDLRQARDARAAALRDLRVAVLRYLIETGQFRVSSDGSFIPPPGLLEVLQTGPAPDGSPSAVETAPEMEKPDADTRQ